MSGERSIRERLAEAMWRAAVYPFPANGWRGVDARTKRNFRYNAGDLLAALPSVGLTLTRNDGGEG